MEIIIVDRLLMIFLSTIQMRKLCSPSWHHYHCACLRCNHKFMAVFKRNTKRYCRDTCAYKSARDYKSYDFIYTVKILCIIGIFKVT